MFYKIRHNLVNISSLPMSRKIPVLQEAIPTNTAETRKGKKRKEKESKEKKERKEKKREKNRRNKETHIPQAQRQTICTRREHSKNTKRALRMPKRQDKTTTHKKNRQVSEEKKTSPTLSPPSNSKNLELTTCFFCLCEKPGSIQVRLYA